MNEKKISRNISFNTLCTLLHTLATFNYRNRYFIKYFLEIYEILEKIERNNDDKSVDKNNEKQIMDGKNYGRVIWSMCVLADKYELSKIYPICE